MTDIIDIKTRQPILPKPRDVVRTAKLERELERDRAEKSQILAYCVELRELIEWRNDLGRITLITDEKYVRWSKIEKNITKSSLDDFKVLAQFVPTVMSVPAFHHLATKARRKRRRHTQR